MRRRICITREKLADLLAAVKGMLSRWASVALNRCALRSSFISRASGFAAANGSVPSIVRSRRASHARVRVAGEALAVGQSFFIM
jgi:hypothetical protein